MSAAESEPDWYEVAEGPELEQGDVLSNCRIARVTDPGGSLAEGQTLGVEFEVHDVCVLTQSCDLANSKVDSILLGRVSPWADVVRAKREGGDPGYASRDMRRKIQQGNVPGVCLIHRRTSAPSLPWSIVDFHTLFTLPRPVLRCHAASLGPRLRLVSPYKEHLAQAFARYFMRVGLPHDARAFLEDPPKYPGS